MSDPNGNQPSTLSQGPAEPLNGIPQGRQPREPFHLFQTLEEELAATPEFWRSRTPLERMEYLEHIRCVISGEDVVNAKMVRCYARGKVGQEPDPKDLVYF